MATYLLNQTSDDGTVLEPVELTIPDETGTYELKFEHSEGQTFPSNVDIEGIETISKSVSAKTGTIGFTDPAQSTTIYQATAKINVGVNAVISNLSATAGIGAINATASYSASTGNITVMMYAFLPNVTVRATVEYDIGSAKGGTFRIDVTFDDGQVLTTTFET